MLIKLQKSNQDKSRWNHENQDWWTISHSNYKNCVNNIARKKYKKSPALFL